MARASFWQQLKTLLKRNLLLKRRNRNQTIQEFLMPIYFILILVLVRYLTSPKDQPAIPSTSEYSLSDSRLDFNTSKILLVSPNNNDVADVASRLAVRLGLTSSQPYQMFASPEEVEANYKTNAQSVLAGIDFTGTLQNMNYTIRVSADTVASTAISNFYTDQGQCRSENGLENSPSGCMANTYLFSGFSRIQVALDTILIQMSAGVNVTSPKLSVQLFPKGKWKSNTATFQILSSIYFVMAYGTFISFLAVNLVWEKQKKIKESMRMMGMRDSAFWLSWGMMYTVIIFTVTLVVVFITWLTNFFPNSNLFIFFLMLMLYGLTIVNLAFALTPFFSRADTAGGLSSLFTIILSLLYFAVYFTKDGRGNPTIPIWALFLLCLISPMTLSLSIDQAIVLDISAGGMNFSTINQGVFPLSYMLVMLAVDVVLYGLLAFYLDNVIPNEYGMARPAWFFLMPSYWYPKKAVASDCMSLIEAGHDDPIIEQDTATREAISPDFQHKNMLRIFDMHKTFKTKKKDVHAVRGISLDIYEGQITALLGHNGAGKTTLIHMLTGMSPATSGRATIYGLNVSDHNELTEIRTMIGLCPQHNILFDDLTPREHLDFYGSLKGVEPDRIDAEVSNSLELIDLTDQADVMSKSLSGGQKRKLCVAIALIGDPKVVFLDEPTAGMDPSSRRHLWTLLKEQQRNKLIVLTTHFMDEADILADRKAIISKGRLQCVGSSLFLKNRFGIGYHLNMVLEPWANTDDISEMVKGQVTEAEIQRHHGKELIFTLPISAVSSFSSLFGALEVKEPGGEARSAKLGIHTYGVSMTSLEEVFLRIGEEAEAEEESENADTNNSSTPLTKNKQYINYATTVNMDNNGEDTDPSVRIQHVIPEIGSDEQLTASELRKQRALALFKLRVKILMRNIPKFVFQVIFPLIFIVAGCAMMRFIPVPRPPPLTSLRLRPSIYANTSGNGKPNMLINYTASSGSDVGSFIESLKKQGLGLADFSDVPGPSPHFLGLKIKDISNSSQVINSEMTVVYNDSAVHSIPTTINALTTALNKMTGRKDAIITYSKPWPRSSITSGFNGAIFGSAMLFGVALNSIAGGFGTNIVRDRLIKAKSQLRLAGVTVNLYWGTVFALDAIQLYSACLVLLFVMLAFQIPSTTTGGAVLCIILMYIVYVPCNMLLSYNLSYIFDKFETAQSSLPAIFTWTSLLPYMAMSMVDMNTVSVAGVAMHYAFTVLLPNYGIMGAFYFIDKVYRKAVAIQDTDKPSIAVADYLDPSSHILITILMPILHIILLYFLLRLNEVRSTGGQWKDCLYCGSSNRVSGEEVSEQNSDIPANEDTDVAAERERVNQSQNTNAVVKVKNLRKEFSRDQKTGCFSCKKKEESDRTRVAVRNSSFLVEPGEVLGLLGPNGAGKTTTLNMIIAETGPTRGKVEVAGHDIRSNMSEAFQAMGYCPQHDALWDDIHLRDHLEVYAASRGIPKAHIKSLSDFFMDSLAIREHADKPAKGLSGGTKRKLSYIISMMGNPKVVLLDEPSTGMDPKSKRFLWDTISSAFNNDCRGALLTTHYMDEADALCSRVAIMVNGQMECLGSTQHLKNKYGGGYHLEVKLKGSVTDERAAENMEALDHHVKNAFQGIIRQEAFGDRAQYRIPQSSITSLSETFNKLEQCKATLNVEEYSFSQATLEQVFLEFAKNQLDDGNIVPEAGEEVASERTRSLHRQLSLQQQPATG